MPIGNTFPIHLRSRTIAQVQTLLSLKRLKSFGHLSNNLKKARFGSHHSEKTEFLRQILRKRTTIVIGNSNQPSHVRTTLTCPQKANYRPVSLTCICCKTLEHILVSNINKHLDSILADCQHGYRSQRSCETQLV